jgi:hypothetical protein
VIVAATHTLHVITLFLFEEILSHSFRGMHVLTFQTDYKLHLYVTIQSSITLLVGEKGYFLLIRKEIGNAGDLKEVNV